LSRRPIYPTISCGNIFVYVVIGDRLVGSFFLLFASFFGGGGAPWHHESRVTFF